MTAMVFDSIMTCAVRFIEKPVVRSKYKTHQTIPFEEEIATPTWEDLWAKVRERDLRERRWRWSQIEAGASR